MAEYVTKEAIYELATYHGDMSTLDDLNPDCVEAVDVSVIRQMPCEDVTPVRYGKWVWHESEYEYECSACGCRFDYNKTYELFDHGFENASYCPNCGAKMIGDGE